MNSDLIELLALFNAANVRYLVVGGVAVGHHAEPRYTKDLDIWISPDPENAQLVYDCLVKFGAPISGLHARDFADEDAFFQMGRPPNRVDLLMSISGLKFGESWSRRD